MQKKVLTIVLTLIMFLSVVVLGGATVFRVDDVSVVAEVVSEQAKTEAEELKNTLLKLYKDENIFAVDSVKAKKVFLNYPHFHFEKFEKSYPNKIVISIVEESEVYAVETADSEYYILGRNGLVLEQRASSQNRLDNASNVLLKGLTVSGEKGGQLVGDDCWESILSLCMAMDGVLGGIRSNVVSVEVLLRAPETFYLITMREGVKIYVGNPKTMTEEKAIKAMNEYLLLSDEERMTGRLTVRDAENEVFVRYSREDEFQP